MEARTEGGQQFRGNRLGRPAVGPMHRADRARHRKEENLILADRENLAADRSEEHTSELQSLMRISYAVFCLKKKKTIQNNDNKEATQKIILRDCIHERERES